MERISATWRSYFDKAKGRLTQAKQSLFHTTVAPYDDMPPEEAITKEARCALDIQNINYDEDTEESTEDRAIYSPKFNMDIEITVEEKPNTTSRKTDKDEDSMSIDGTETRNVFLQSADIDQRIGSDQNNALEVEEPMVTVSPSTPSPHLPDSRPAEASQPSTSVYTRVLTLKEEYEFYGALAYDPFSSRRGNVSDRRPIIRHTLCCDNCDRIGHRWMYCPEPCWECGSFHSGYLICGSRDLKRRADREWQREEDAKRVRLRGYTEKRVPGKMKEEWVPLLVENTKSSR
ncbi:hypothetical protein N431DRAFT_500103 [Stipitochalara longipes BDJ]|nr:hypothetical protein N431DRAFT_500103 [Stipitochalara longipes BDJ]